MIYSKVGENVRLMRRRRGLTQKELAAKCKTSVQTISGIENGSKRVTLMMLDKISNALDCDLTCFLDLGDKR